MQRQFDTDVLICGAGASGLTLALELARRNVAFHLIEKADGPFMGSRGKGIQPRTLEIFEDMGILDRIVGIGGPYPKIRHYRASGAVDETAVESGEPNPRDPYTAPLMLPQFITEAILRERLLELGHSSTYGCELVGFEQDEQGVSAELVSAQGTRTVRARYLLGTDGGRSFVRHALGIAFPGATLPIRAVVADLHLDGLDRAFWHRWGESVADQIALCPLHGTDYFQLQAPIASDEEGELTVDSVAKMIATRTGRNDIVVHQVHWGSAYQMNSRLADRYRVGRALLVGDAAHVHPPTGGQGLNTSVQDAYNLGWKIAAVLTGAPDALLDTYETERRPIAASVLGLSGKLLQAARERSELRRGREVHQLDLCYRDSPLSADIGRDESILRAGDRAPDAHYQAPTGQPKRIFDLLQGPHWTLLAYEINRDRLPCPRTGLRRHGVGSSGDLRDSHGEIRTHYAFKPGDWALIRPDGYIGALGDSSRFDLIDRILGFQFEPV